MTSNKPPAKKRIETPSTESATGKVTIILRIQDPSFNETLVHFEQTQDWGVKSMKYVIHIVSCAIEYGPWNGFLDLHLLLGTRLASIIVDIRRHSLEALSMSLSKFDYGVYSALAQEMFPLVYKEQYTDSELGILVEAIKARDQELSKEMTFALQELKRKLDDARDGRYHPADDPPPKTPREARESSRFVWDPDPSRAVGFFILRARSAYYDERMRHSGRILG